jgi:integrase
MVAWREPSSPLRRLVDGQQRITTIAIIFAILRDQLAALGETNLADGIHRYLEKADRNNERRFTLQTEVASPFLAQAIFKSTPDTTVQPSSEEEIALSKALQAIKQHVSEEVGKRQNPLKWLLTLRDRLLGLRVIWIEHSNEDEAGLRTIPLSPETVRRLTKRRAESRYAGDTDPIFPSATGTRIDPHNFRHKVFKPAAKRAGVSWATPHKLRHGLASLMANRGYSPSQIAAHLGHADGGVLALRTYIHADRLDSAEFIDQAFAD